jgi:hypothetical protein
MARGGADGNNSLLDSSCSGSGSGSSGGGAAPHPQTSSIMSLSELLLDVVDVL